MGKSVMINNKEAGIEAFVGLLDEFRKGNVTNDKREMNILGRHMEELSKIWNQKFSGFPEHHFPYTSWRGARRGPRDENLKKIIISTLMNCMDFPGDRIIVNPACFLGKRARYLASNMKQLRVIGTDIDTRYNGIYKYLSKTPDNFKFIKDDIFNPKLEVIPSAVVFFGACGSVTDAAMDYAIDSKSPYLFCRTCCHQNIGGNTEIAKKPTLLNYSWRTRGRWLSKIKMRMNNVYFSEKYSGDRYPRSIAAAEISNPKEFQALSSNAADSDISRTIIDLDRYLYLVENGYDAWYQGEMFIAIADFTKSNRF